MTTGKNYKNKLMFEKQVSLGSETLSTDPWSPHRDTEEYSIYECVHACVCMLMGVSVMLGEKHYNP